MKQDSTLPPARTGALHGLQAPSSWVCHWGSLAPQGSRILDVACGGGRHMRWFSQHGYVVMGVDRDPAAVDVSRKYGETLLADLENGPWPLPGQRFGGVVVTNYLWRPLFPALLDSIDVGGVLVYETFASGNETVGKPSRPDFLLQPGELLRVCAGDEWRIIAYEDGFLRDPDRFVQRVAAVRQSIGILEGSDRPKRYALQASA